MQFIPWQSFTFLILLVGVFFMPTIIGFAVFQTYLVATDHTSNEYVSSLPWGLDDMFLTVKFVSLRL
jgi:hypothetical protein